MRLAVRLAAVYIILTAVAVGIVIYRASDAAGTLGDRELSLRAQDLARAVSLDAAGRPRLDLPAKLQAVYAVADGVDIFAIRAADRGVVAAVPPGFGARVASWPPPTDDPSYFRIGNLTSGAPDYYGLSLAVDSAAGPLWISVARVAGSDALVTSVLREFVVDIAWMIPVLVVLTLAIGVLVIRRGLAPVRIASALAADIGPSATGIRLPEKDLPTEIAPLVAAVNRALDRLEQGFDVQRQFTANAAHELRTPLAIITAALEGTEADRELDKLRLDVARMSRLVEQLLRVARLDAVALDVSERVDLAEVAASLVSAMAPWAVAQGRSIGLAATTAVHVRGNTHAIADAVRNLIENAVVHSPRGAEVTVSVEQDGSVSVADCGPGIEVNDRDNIYERFWRGKRAPSQGAGLGLAIVLEIVKAHRGTISVRDNHGGGAVFTLGFARAA